MNLLRRKSTFGGIKFDAIPVRVIKIDLMGNLEENYVTIESLARDVRNEEKLSFASIDGVVNQVVNHKRARMPIRDFKMFSPLDTINLIDDENNVVKVIERKKHPAIMPRPSAKCFLLELEEIKIFCKNNECLIFHPEQTAGELKIKPTNVPRSSVSFIESFALDLKDNLVQDTQLQSSFELTVLEVVLSNVASRLMKQLSVMKPVLETLIHEILSSNPPTEQMLRKILALKQNLTKFEHDVIAIQEVVFNTLSNDQDMADLRLSSLDHVGQVDISEHEDVELVFEALSAYLSHIVFELKRMDADIHDVEDFVSIHLSSTRNKILRLSLFMEIGMLSVAFCAMLAGIFGMNIGMGNKEWWLPNSRPGFFITIGIIVLLSIGVSIVCFKYYYTLDKDTTQAQKSNFYVLKNLTLVVDEVAARIKDKSNGQVNINMMTKSELDSVLNDVVIAQPDEQDLIFKSVTSDDVAYDNRGFM